MAQTTQIVPKWSFPYVETHVNDNTLVTDIIDANTVDTSIKFAFAVAASKGIDNTWVRKTKKSDAIKTFGDSNFKKYGQPLMQALHVLDKDNSQVWIMRVMPENATLANSIVSAYYKADSADEVEDPHKRKFRIKLTAKSLADITSKDAFKAAANTLDGVANIKVDGVDVYKDAEGFIQVPFMAVNYAGRGTCGNNYSMRLSQASTYEKEFGIKMYNFEVLTSETSIVKDANYVGGLVSSMKYGTESTTLIDDVLSNVDAGVAPIDIKVNEDNVEVIYDAYIEFLKVLHEDLVAEYEAKLDEYNVPEEMLNGTAVVTEEYADKVSELKAIAANIDETDDSALPALDEFDLIFGRKVASDTLLPGIAYPEALTDLIDTTADDYDASNYTSTKLVDFQSAKGLELLNGGNGYFDNPRTEVIDGKNVQRTYEQELEECYIKAFNGSYDKRILSNRRVGVTAFWDANYPMKVKTELVNLAGARYECRVYLDANFISSLSTNVVNGLIRDFSIFDNHMVSVDIHNYVTREYSTNKKVDVTISYFLAAQYVDHLTNYGYHIPFCKEYAQLSGHVKDSLKPVVEEYDNEIKEILNENRLNYFECISENVFQRATQNTTQKANTDLLEESNSTILYNFKNNVEKDTQAQLYNFAEESVRNSFIEVEKAKYASMEGSVVESFNIYFAVSEYEFTHSILHCYLELVFRGLNKQAIVEIDLNKRTYSTATTDEE